MQVDLWQEVRFVPGRRPNVAAGVSRSGHASSRFVRQHDTRPTSGGIQAGRSGESTACLSAQGWHSQDPRGLLQGHEDTHRDRFVGQSRDDLGAGHVPRERAPAYLDT